MRSSDLYLLSILVVIVSLSFTQVRWFQQLESKTPNQQEQDSSSTKTFSTIIMDSSNPFKSDTEAVVSKCEEILKSHPGNRCCKYLKEYVTSDEFKGLSETGKL